MVNLFPNNFIITVANAIIDDIRSDNRSTFVTISYTDWSNGRKFEQTVQLVVGRNTTILDERGNIVPVSELTPGMIVNASFSSSMTRSIPPQANAFLIRIVRRAASENIITGKILTVDRENRSFTTASDRNASSITRFNVPRSTPIYDSNGRTMNFSRLMPGMRVKVRHADVMTESIPPQTTAFEVRVL